MENLLLARIDDRLIHGQVMTAWMKVKPAKQIMVIDDKVAKDEFMIDVIRLAAPTGVKVTVHTCDDAAATLQKGLSVPTILLAKTPKTYKRLLDAGIVLHAINVGGMGVNAERRTLYKNIAASDAERDMFREFLDKGIDVKIQIIPANNAVDMKDAL
ncbi:PTS sugar transporter subunit IIB [Selenomonas sp. TAMA-11512]|uniref:PTS sugar transporter subunit IIB n=1 Tax=Selenomonas sp. TAMA-11512 TaxID=3095337 RepID=UPI003089005D|nr:PTS sugar transporter subunit IIB [Selenomonas sp. TAMA-11512]